MYQDPQELKAHTPPKPGKHPAGRPKTIIHQTPENVKPLKRGRKGAKMKTLMESAIEIVERVNNIDSTDINIKDFINDQVNFCARTYEEYNKIWELIENLMK